MQHAYPLAIIPLQSDSSSRSSSRSGSPDHVTMRALIPRRDNEARNTPVRSEHDAALMRSLISLLPHEQADTQVCSTCDVLIHVLFVFRHQPTERQHGSINIPVLCGVFNCEVRDVASVGRVWSCLSYYAADCQKY